MTIQLIEAAFQHVCTEHSDIYLHCPRLRKLAERCNIVVEFGVRTGRSTVCFFAAGVHELHSYDVTPIPKCLHDLGKEAITNFIFHQRSSLEVEIPHCDLLMVDSLHTQHQLTYELRLHANAASKYIVLHDTETFAEVDEFTLAPGGLRPVIDEFLSENFHWGIKSHHPENNGLTILERG